MIAPALDDALPFVVARVSPRTGLAGRVPDDRLALLHNRGHRCHPQADSDKTWADNGMLHIGVRDAGACHAAIAGLVADGRFPGVRIAAPKRELCVRRSATSGIPATCCCTWRNGTAGMATGVRSADPQRNPNQEMTGGADTAGGGPSRACRPRRPSAAPTVSATPMY